MSGWAKKPQLPREEQAEADRRLAKIRAKKQPAKNPVEIDKALAEALEREDRIQQAVDAAVLAEGL